MKSISGEGRGGTQSVISQRGARDGLFLRREGGCNSKHYWFNWFLIFYPMPLQQDKTFC